MQIDATDVINRITQELAQTIQAKVIAEAQLAVAQQQLSEAQQQLQEKNEEN